MKIIGAFIGILTLAKAAPLEDELHKLSAQYEQLEGRDGPTRSKKSKTKTGRSSKTPNNGLQRKAISSLNQEQN